MNILYALSGHGLGHATRSQPIIQHLSARGHNVHIATSDRAYALLRKHFDNVHKIYGLRIIYRHNRVANLETIFDNLRLPSLIKTLRTLKKIVKREKIDLIITDFEIFSCWIGAHFKIPVISLDNQHIYSNTLVLFPFKYYDDYLKTKLVNELMIPLADFYLIISFFKPKIIADNTVIIPPIIRNKIIQAKAKRIKKNQIVIYQTSRSNEKLPKILKQFSQEKFLFYGYDLDKKDQNILYKKFSENGFIKDLANCKALIANGGLSLICEAIYLGIPVLSEPIQGTFEQACNSLYLDKAGYGKHAEKLTADDLSKFLKNIPVYAEKLKKYKQNGNEDAWQILDQTIKKLYQAKKCGSWASSAQAPLPLIPYSLIKGLGKKYVKKINTLAKVLQRS